LSDRYGQRPVLLLCLCGSVAGYGLFGVGGALWVLFLGRILDGLTEGHRRLLRTTNGLERVNRELKRRTRVVGIFPNEASCLRLVSALLMELSEEWETGRAYLTYD
jgi:MFS family permease